LTALIDDESYKVVFDIVLCFGKAALTLACEVFVLLFEFRAGFKSCSTLTGALVFD